MGMRAAVAVFGGANRLQRTLVHLPRDGLGETGLKVKSLLSTAAHRHVKFRLVVVASCKWCHH